MYLCIAFILAIEKIVQMQGMVQANIFQYYLTLKQKSCLIYFL
jgi:hypothetical protein